MNVLIVNYNVTMIVYFVYFRIYVLFVMMVTIQIMDNV